MEADLKISQPKSIRSGLGSKDLKKKEERNPS